MINPPGFARRLWKKAFQVEGPAHGNYGHVEEKQHWGPFGCAAVFLQGYAASDIYYKHWICRIWASPGHNESQSLRLEPGNLHFK